MLSALVLAAAANVSAQFFDDFGGNWTCGNANYHAQWSITSPAGNYWTLVQYGVDLAHLGGTAYVGWLPLENKYIYNDYHNDGSFSQLTSPAPAADGVWHWTGRFYMAGATSIDTALDILWTRVGDKIERRFRKNENGKLTEMGADSCTKAGNASFLHQ